MENMVIVRPEHLNHYGYLFGGQLLKWVDEFAWIAATRENPGNMLVTRAMDEINFTQKVINGSILRFSIIPEKKGLSSLLYSVNVYADEPHAENEKHVFSTKITFACIDKNGKKTRLN